jgi:hypothetical protein
MQYDHNLKKTKVPALLKEGKGLTFTKGACIVKEVEIKGFNDNFFFRYYFFS